jgi:nucleotide-binding universal stress UspA family protein
MEVSMYEHILVALDSSVMSRDVVKQAIALASAVNAKLSLLHVLSSDEVMSPTMPLIPVPEYYPSLSVTTLELYQEEWKRFQSKSAALLEDYKTQATSAGLSTECYQRTGRPGQTICEVAKDLKVDLIMVGRRGHSVFDEMLVGSVSSYVIHHAPTAVLVCNTQAKKGMGAAADSQSQPCSTH